jgi:hypothetical protein
MIIESEGPTDLIATTEVLWYADGRTEMQVAVTEVCNN